VHFDMGSVPDWVEAFGTSGALIFLAVQHRFDRRKDRADREAAADLKRDEEKRQARLVTVSLGWNFGMGEGHSVTMNLTNHSEQPLRDLIPVAEDRESGRDEIDLQGSSFSESSAVGPAGRTGFSRVRFQNQPLPREHGNDNRGQEDLERRLRIGVEFTDAEGRRWLQTPSGVPVRRHETR
jgi:hypothetical protein